MNPTNPSTWNNPPPPGIDMDEDSKHSTVSSKSVTGSTNDTIDPYIKNPDYIRYKKSLSRECSTHHRRSRSRSHERKRSKSRDKRRRHRSRSRGRRRRSRSRSRGGRRHRRYSHSSSRSRSSSYDNERSRHKHKKRRSRRSRSRTHRHKSDRRTRRSKSHTPTDLNDSLLDNDPSDTKEDEEPDVSKENAFKNDGSFMEMFKKMQEEKEKAEAEKSAAGSSEIRKPLPAFGKRRGGRVLKTGMVEKTKTQEDEDVGNAQDPWSIYLKEVKRYKEVCCDDDSKTRPLVK